jgi:hypothetical protein
MTATSGWRKTYLSSKYISIRIDQHLYLMGKFLTVSLCITDPCHLIDLNYITSTQFRQNPLQHYGLTSIRNNQPFGLPMHPHRTKL